MYIHASYTIPISCVYILVRSSSILIWLWWCAVNSDDQGDWTFKGYMSLSYTYKIGQEACKSFP